MKKRTSGRGLKALAVLGLCAMLADACGGRVVAVGDGMATNSGAGGGAASGFGASGGKVGGVGASGGKVNGGAGRANGGAGNVASGGWFSAGTTSSAGSSSGGWSSAGSSSAGTAGSGCGFVACTPISCPPGVGVVYPPGNCCPVCQLGCTQSCPALACPAGFQIQTLPGQCCPSCVPTMAVCSAGLTNYYQFRASVVSKEAFGCGTAADCTVAAPINLCESGCSYVAVSTSELGSMLSMLMSDSFTDCAQCGPMPTPPCLPPPGLACVGGRCVTL